MTATGACNGISVSWPTVPFAVGYAIYRNTQPNTGAGLVQIELNDQSPPYLDDTAATGTTYYYFVQPRCTQGFGAISNPSNPVQRATVPGAPTNVQASDGTFCTHTQVTWSSVSGATSYDVFRSTGASQPSNPIANVAATSYSDSSAVAGTTYRYWVEARNACGAGSPGGPDTGWRRQAPSAPGGVSASDGSSCSSVLISWNQVSGATNYKVYRHTTNNFASAGLIASVGASPFPDSGALPAGATYYYWVVANNGVCDGPPSSSNTGFILAAPGVPSQPAAQPSGCLGAQVSWTAASSATSYTIRRATTSNFGASAVVGTDTASPFTDTVPAAGTYFYWIVASNNCGSGAAAGPASVTPLSDPPSIIQDPQSTSACTGQPTTFTSAANGSSLSFQWRRNGQPIGGATQSSYSIASVSPSSAGAYDVVVTNACGSDVSASATLTVLAPPVVVSPPLDVAACTGTPASFSVAATSTNGPLTYQWTRNAVDLVGQTASTLQLSSVTPADQGTYAVRISDGTCLTTSSSAQLTVLTVPQITQPPAPVLACPQAAVQLTVNATGGQLAYQWRRNGAPIPGAVTAVLSGTAGTLGAGSYDVVVSNPCGNTLSASASLTVRQPPSIVIEPQSVWVCEGRPLTLCVSAAGDAPLAYTWRRNGVVVAGASSACFTRVSASTNDGGSYRVDVSNACGLVSSIDVDVTVVPLVPAAWSSLASSANGDVHAICVVDEAGGQAIYAGGAFTQIGGVTANRAARFDGSSWQPLGTGLNDDVWALAAHDDGTGTALYAGGSFTSAGGVSASKIARWNGVSWSAVGGGVSGGGQTRVLAMHSFDDGGGPALWIGGTFTDSVRRWSAGAWTSAGNGLNDDVYAFVEHTDVGGTALYAGGDFGSGVSTPRGVARWNGAAWVAVGAFSSSNTPVRALASANGTLYAAGVFSNGALAYAAQWSGVDWEAMGSGLNGPVAALAAFDEGDGVAIYAGGEFTSAGGQPAARIARWKSNAWTALGSGASNRVMALAATGQGLGEQLVAGGSFTSIGGVAAARIAAWSRPSLDCPGVHCTSSTTSNGCTPTIVGSGSPSASASSGYTLCVSSLESQRQGLMFYGVSGAQAAPWAPGSSSFLCVKSPTQRMALQTSAGVGGACDGVFFEDFNAYQAANPGALGQPFASGQRIDCQAWFRDPAAPKTTSLSNALEFTLGP